MLNRFYPDEYLKSIDRIDFERYYRQGIRGIISDIDNTLVPHGFPADEHIIKVFEKIHALGIDTCRYPTIEAESETFCRGGTVKIHI